MARISQIRKKTLEFASLHSYRISDSCLPGFLIIILSDGLRLRRAGLFVAKKLSSVKFFAPQKENDLL